MHTVMSQASRVPASYLYQPLAVLSVALPAAKFGVSSV